MFVLHTAEKFNLFLAIIAYDTGPTRHCDCQILVIIFTIKKIIFFLVWWKIQSVKQNQNTPRHFITDLFQNYVINTIRLQIVILLSMNAALK